MTKEDLQNRLVNKFSEFETKYEVELVHLEKFGTTLQESTRHFEVHQYDGRDDYYTNREGNYIRHRLNGEDQELTIKRTLDEDTTHRIELNLDVMRTDEDIVAKFIGFMGYKYNFTIFKTSLVYNFADAAVAFYTVCMKDQVKPRCFVEIEVYNNIKGLDEKKAWRIIKKYEKMLYDIRVTESGRLNKSLFDLYKQEDSYGLVRSA